MENELVIITGLSGAGKTEVTRCFEDLGYFCVDNLPPTFIPKFAELILQSEGKIDKVALVSDIRGGEFFDSLQWALDELGKYQVPYEILFLEADTPVLIRRYKETRRRHPLSGEYNIEEAIKKERQKLQQVKNKADKILNTGSLNPKDLKSEIKGLFAQKSTEDYISITLISFGYKHGLPMDSDLVFDARCLPNPHYIDEYRDKTGEDENVRDYVLKSELSHKFLEKVRDFIDFLIPCFVDEGRTQLVIAIGCTGGRHRSVTIVNWLQEDFYKKGKKVLTLHRDKNK